MKKKYGWMFAALVFVLLLFEACKEEAITSVTIPITLDHNRMIVEGEIQRIDGSWRKVRLWVDTGNPDFFISEDLAGDLGIDIKDKKDSSGNSLQSLSVNPPSGVRIGGKQLDFTSVNTLVMFSPRWLFTTMHVDANLPSTVLKKYQVVFDYPGLKFTLADQGTITPKGEPSSASINSNTGIVQIDALVDEDSLSFALDNGASYSVISDEVMIRLSNRNPVWQVHTGAVGCANIWGWWPGEQSWPLIRIPEIEWESVVLKDVGVIGLPQIINWYSQKTAEPIDGFLGANAFKSFRIEIDYKNNKVYFEKGTTSDIHDLDIIGLALRLEDDGNFRVVGVVQENGRSTVEGVEPGDLIIQIDNIKARGETMGNVVDALRGKPGDYHTLIIEREGKQIKVDAKVRRFL